MKLYRTYKNKLYGGKDYFFVVAESYERALKALKDDFKEYEPSEIERVYGKVVVDEAEGNKVSHE